MIERVQPGQPVRPKAAQQNLINESADFYARHREGAAGGGLPSNVVTPAQTIRAVLGANLIPPTVGDSCLLVPQVSAVTIDPTDPLAYQRQPTVIGHTISPAGVSYPNSEDNSTPIGIALEPAGYKTAGRVAVGGHVACRLNLTNLSHRYARGGPPANLSEEHFGPLVSDWEGPARILWTESDWGETGVQQAIVQLGVETGHVGFTCETAVATTYSVTFPGVAAHTPTAVSEMHTLSKMTLPALPSYGGYLIQASVELEITNPGYTWRSFTNPPDSATLRAWIGLDSDSTGYTAAQNWTDTTTIAATAVPLTAGTTRGSATFVYKYLGTNPAPTPPKSFALTVGFSGNVTPSVLGDVTVTVVVRKWSFVATRLTEIAAACFATNAAPTVTLDASYLDSNTMPLYTTGKAYQVLAQDAEDGFDVSVSLTLSDTTVILSGELIYKGSGLWQVAFTSGAAGTCTVTVTVTDSSGQTGTWSQVVTVSASGGIVGGGGDEGGGVP